MISGHLKSKAAKSTGKQYTIFGGKVRKKDIMNSIYLKSIPVASIPRSGGILNTPTKLPASLPHSINIT